MTILGMQHSVILAAQPYGLGLNETLLPQHLQKLGYATHAVGKVSGVKPYLICSMKGSGIYYICSVTKSEGSIYFKITLFS